MLALCAVIRPGKCMQGVSVCGSAFRMQCLCVQIHGVPTLLAVQAVLRREGVRACSCIDY